MPEVQFSLAPLIVLISKYLSCVEKQLSVDSKILLNSENTNKAKQIKNTSKFSN